MVHGDPQEITGRIAYADAIVKEFGLEPVDLTAAAPTAP